MIQTNHNAVFYLAKPIFCGYKRNYAYSVAVGAIALNRESIAIELDYEVEISISITAPSSTFLHRNRERKKSFERRKGSKKAKISVCVIARRKGAIAECRATSCHLCYRCQNLWKNEVENYRHFCDSMRCK